ncbi:FecCD family ABC transporter permease [Austwickia chelonae]|uniref:FecCD family ABC transporter permease n=1 Tax=Austwickia chelonae TaxID=100225 RepID=UPI001F071E88|nr:iron chelate uptake ABC transporter family permease subunit [Austwickia chelonae]
MKIEAPRPLGLAALWAAGIAALILSVVVTVTFGPAPISVTTAWNILLERLGATTSGASALEIAMVADLRLPRVLLAAFCGAGLSICGVVLQSLLRNPLADPYLLGVSSGASTGAVCVLVLGVGSTLGLSGGALLGAVTAFGAMLLLARLAGGTTATVVLAGIAVTQGFSALTSFIVMIGADATTTRGVLFWLMGSLATSSWEDVALAAAALALGLLLCLFCASSLDAFAFGERAAASLGVSVVRIRGLLLLVTASMTAVIVSSSGAIGFVGLVLPHIARAMVGSRHRVLMPTAALVGAIFLVWADTIARTAFAPLEVPVGVMTALVGVPVFAFILVRRRRAS